MRRVSRTGSLRVVNQCQTRVVCTSTTRCSPKPPSCSTTLFPKSCHPPKLSCSASRSKSLGEPRSSRAPNQQKPSGRPRCACGQRITAEQRRPRSVLLFFGLIRFSLRRYRCPACGAWVCPGAARLELGPQQQMTRTLQEIITTSDSPGVTRSLRSCWAGCAAAGWVVRRQ